MDRTSYYHPLFNPSTGFNLTWKNISYKIKKKDAKSCFADRSGRRESKYTSILHRVSGVVNSGTLMAIMGPSGSGKTTTLATISRRIKGESSGMILLNGELVTKEQMTRISGFVPQEDFSVESLTVQEHMEFMACMKMDRRVGTTLKRQRIIELLTELGLNECAKSKLLALSGGERKRVSLAVQLLTEPSLLFCDEPTTGLDSYNALAVVRILRRVAERGKIVICSIHQPASGLLELFDEIILLAAGNVAFQGTIKEATLFFDSLGQVCPPTYNNAEFYVSQLSVECRGETGSYKRAKWICEEYRKSIFGTQNRLRIENSCRISPMPNFLKFLERKTAYSDEYERVGLFAQLKWLTWRSYLDWKRNKATTFSRFVSYMGIAVFVSLPFIGVTHNIDQRGIQNLQGLLYFMVTQTMFSFSYRVSHSFPSEIPSLLRDMTANLYHPAPYYLSKIIVMLPEAVFQPLCYSALIFAITGLKGGLLGFFIFALPIIFCAISASAYGCLISASFESFDVAILFSVPIEFLSMMFSGIFLHLGNLPPRISWIKYCSQIYYAIEAVSISQWGEINHINCSLNPEEPCTSTGIGVMEKYGYDMEDYIVDLIGLFAIFIVCHFGGYLAIYRRSKKDPVY